MRRIGVLTIMLVIGCTGQEPPEPAADSVTPAKLTGVLVDSTGMGIMMANVQLDNLETGAFYGSATGPQGQFYVPGIPPGRYSIRISKGRIAWPDTITFAPGDSLHRVYPF